MKNNKTSVDHLDAIRKLPSRQKIHFLKMSDGELLAALEADEPEDLSNDPTLVIKPQRNEMTEAVSELSSLIAEYGLAVLEHPFITRAMHEMRLVRPMRK